MASAVQLGQKRPSEPRLPVCGSDINVGGIVWIRQKTEIDPRFINGLSLETHSFNHPAVVINKDKQGDSESLVTIAPMTSFGSRELTSSHPDNRSFWERYLPVAPSPPHPISGTQLVLRNGGVLEKPSYIQITCYDVAREVLAHYTRGRNCPKHRKGLRLTQGSLKQLISQMPDPVSWTPAEATIGPRGTTLSNEAIWDVKLTLGAQALDDGTFERLLRLCRVCSIEVTVAPAQTSTIPSNSLIQSSGTQCRNPEISPAIASSGARRAPTRIAYDNRDHSQEAGSAQQVYMQLHSSIKTLSKLYLMSCDFLQAHLKSVVCFGRPRKDPRFLAVTLATRMLWSLHRENFPWYVDDDAALGVPEMTKKMEHKGINNRILKKLEWVQQHGSRDNPRNYELTLRSREELLAFLTELLSLMDSPAAFIGRIFRSDDTV
ncbi:hypothetical protein V496_01635 [Pseudogymnoascus sp. VKM F-4515 (FW-2607)]|nr:hypothetical protein V496_01635 [Pseudogymnoascus sp. VKM F-4515 (FW-2607)]